jgi:hypothetical protein
MIIFDAMAKTSAHEIRDQIWTSAPVSKAAITLRRLAGWSRHSGQYEVAEQVREVGAGQGIKLFRTKPLS